MDHRFHVRPSQTPWRTAVRVCVPWQGNHPGRGSWGLVFRGSEQNGILGAPRGARPALSQPHPPVCLAAGQSDQICRPSGGQPGPGPGTAGTSGLRGLRTSARGRTSRQLRGPRCGALALPAPPHGAAPLWRGHVPGRRHRSVAAPVEPLAATTGSGAVVHPPAWAGVRGVTGAGGRSDRRGCAPPGDQPNTSPPSTIRFWPVTARAQGEAKNSTASATSSGVVTRPSAVCEAI